MEIQQQHQRPAHVATKRTKQPSVKFMIIAVIGLVIAGFLAYTALSSRTAIDKSKYQAVFLENGQVYFGKLTGWNGARPILTDVYYFQAATSNSSAGANAAEASQQSTSQTLVKLGEEIHKPSDKLIINKDAVLFIENIEDSGEVVKAIKKDKEADR